MQSANVIFCFLRITVYGDTGKDLRDSPAMMARTLATRKVNVQPYQSTSLEAFLPVA